MKFWIMTAIFMVLAAAGAVAQDRVVPPEPQYIIGGSMARPAVYPWMVALVGRADDYAASQYCGGTLIAPAFVLTAGHCAEVFSRNSPVVVGAYDLDRRDGRLVRGERAFSHPYYDSITLDYDIALIRLERPVTGVTPLRLATARTPAGQMATVVGWGDTDPDDDRALYPSLLQQVDLPIVAQSECRAALDEVFGQGTITARMLCAGVQQGGVDACQGDSGGPLIVRGRDGVMRQIGIVSFGNGCGAPDSPGVYSDVVSLRDFILDTLQAEGRLAAVAATPGQRAVAEALDRSNDRLQGEMADLYRSALLSSVSVQQRFLETVQPQAAFGQILFGRQAAVLARGHVGTRARTLFRNKDGSGVDMTALRLAPGPGGHADGVIDDHLASRSGIAIAGDSSDPDLPEGIGLFVSGDAMLGDRTWQGGGASSRFRTGGLAVGGDVRVSPTLALGASLDLADGHSRWPGWGESDSRDAGVTLFGVTALGRGYAQGYVSAGIERHETWRQIDLGPTTRRARGETDGWRLGAGLEAGYPVFWNGMTVSPLARFDLTRVAVDGYGEQGAGSLSLDVAGRTDLARQGAVGGEVLRSWPLGEGGGTGWLTVQGHLLLNHAFDDGDAVEARLRALPGAPFTVRAGRGDPTWLEAGLGLGYWTASGLGLSLGYRTDLGRRDGGSHRLSFGGRLRW